MLPRSSTTQTTPSTTQDSKTVAQSSTKSVEQRIKEMYEKAKGYHVGTPNHQQQYSVARYWYTKVSQTKTTYAVETQRRLAHLQTLEQKSIQPKDSSYNTQVIIGFRHIGDSFSDSVIKLATKWQLERRQTCQLFFGGEFLRFPCEMENYTNKPLAARIYINAHGSEAFDSISDEHGIDTHFTALANVLAPFIGKHRVTVNLLSCFGGSGKKPQHVDSFASQLHIELARLTARKDIDVVARTSLITVKDKMKMTYDLTRLNDTSFIDSPTTCIRKQPGSKVRFQFDANGRQTRVDAYAKPSVAIPTVEHKEALEPNPYEIATRKNWREKITTKLKNAESTPLSSSQHDLIQRWLSIFPTKTEEEIFNLIKMELDSPSALHSTTPNGLFGNSSTIATELKQLLAEGKEFFDETYQPLGNTVNQ